MWIEATTNENDVITDRVGDVVPGCDIPIISLQDRDWVITEIDETECAINVEEANQMVQVQCQECGTPQMIPLHAYALDYGLCEWCCSSELILDDELTEEMEIKAREIFINTLNNLDD